MKSASLSQLGNWADLPFFTDTWPKIDAALKAEKRQIFPPENQIFAALEHVAPEDVRVIILGQDPYPTPDHAHGYAFSASEDTRPLPKSLANIFKELRTDVGSAPGSADLRFWADQGVLLLNTALTVPAGEPKGHAHLGWQELTQQVLARLADRPRAYILWGESAQKVAAAVDADRNLKIQSVHPSPLSASRGFFGSRPFSQVNDWLHAQGLATIHWTDS